MKRLSKQNEQDIEGIASDAVEGQFGQKYNNKTKSIVTNAIAEALKESIEKA